MAAQRVLGHAVLDRARRAARRGACRRETPISLTLADGTMVEGQVDLAFEEAESWTVVDYKTDRELSTGQDRYQRQLSLYVAAIAHTTGRPATGVLMRI
jgi:ATP-dependent exoDNAse (exonuclease V) beta subunit